MNTLFGRSSSHFTRVVRIFAEELGVALELVPIFEVTRTEPAIYGGNPALKMPTLRRDGALTFGTENICRALVPMATRPKRIVWPEAVSDALTQNAQEMIWHSMTAQVQLIFGNGFSKLPADNVYFVKAAAGLTGALQWLDDNVDAALSGLALPRDLSLFEVTLFCLMEHLTFRPTVPVDAYARLSAFTTAFAERTSAQRTRYAIDPRPAP